MKLSLVYGYKNIEAEKLKIILEDLIQLPFSDHLSANDQEYYFAGEDGSENFVITYNYDDTDDCWNYPDHTDYKTLLTINDTTRSEEFKKLLREKLPEFVLLEEFEEE